MSPWDESSMSHLNCRFCATPLHDTFCDLGMSPISNAFVSMEAAHGMEPFYPLHAYVCSNCFLVQLGEFESPSEIFADDYAYFSSVSKSWLAHCEAYVEQMVERFRYSASSRVVEVASNDGYLLQYFVRHGVPVLGIEPTANTAKVAIEKGIPTRIEFFGRESADRLLRLNLPADLIIGNNVLAHVPDINDFVAGLKIALNPSGVITMEFPHLLRLMEHNQFDTIYHEHFSYLSLGTVQRIFAAHGLRLFDVEELGTHGGSLRIYACHADDADKDVGPSVGRVNQLELAAGLDRIKTYAEFQKRVEQTKRNLLRFLIDARDSGKTVVGYGAPAKGNTLLNYCGIRTDLLAYTVDLSPRKQGTLLPGVRIPVLPPAKIEETRPDYLLILPWNLRSEIVAQMEGIRAWGGKFVVPIPSVEVIE